MEYSEATVVVAEMFDHLHSADSNHVSPTNIDSKYDESVERIDVLIVFSSPLLSVY